MTPKIKKIVAVVRKDATTRFIYKKPNGTTCAIGGLAEAAGIPLPPKDSFEVSILSSQVTSFADALSNHYGLSLDQLDSIQDINDQHRLTTSRRKAIIDYVESLNGE
jgi:hypothetical protein